MLNLHAPPANCSSTAKMSFRTKLPRSRTQASELERCLAETNPSSRVYSVVMQNLKPTVAECGEKFARAVYPSPVKWLVWDRCELDLKILKQWNSRLNGGGGVSDDEGREEILESARLFIFDSSDCIAIEKGLLLGGCGRGATSEAMYLEIVDLDFVTRIFGRVLAWDKLARCWSVTFENV